jgi:Flp pilus assembly protein TadG
MAMTNLIHTQPASRAARRRRRGTVLIYTAVSLVFLLGLVSLAVDYGRVQTIKQDLQRCADATALGGLTAYVDTGYSIPAATTAAYSLVTQNPVDQGSGVMQTVSLVAGTWDLNTRTFSTSFYAGQPACQVVMSRTAANGNPVPLMFGKAIGMTSADVRATATAVLIDNSAQGITVPATGNPYLAGMPAGSSSPWGDNDTNATPYRITSIPVVPGMWISFTNPSGTTSILPGSIPYFDANGEATRPLHHGQNQDGTNFNIGPENGIGDAIMPAGAVMGLFLTDNAPTAMSPPPTVDWTNAAIKDKPSYNNIPVQAPFLIGNGMTSGGTVKMFQVPPGATRLFLGTWDGVVQSNNLGSINATINLKRSVRLVK